MVTLGACKEMTITEWTCALAGLHDSYTFVELGRGLALCRTDKPRTSQAYNRESRLFPRQGRPALKHLRRRICWKQNVGSQGLTFWNLL